MISGESVLFVDNRYLLHVISQNYSVWIINSEGRLMNYKQNVFIGSIFFHLALDFEKLVYRQDPESVMLSRTEWRLSAQMLLLGELSI